MFSITMICTTTTTVQRESLKKDIVGLLGSVGVEEKEYKLDVQCRMVWGKTTVEAKIRFEVGDGEKLLERLKSAERKGLLASMTFTLRLDPRWKEATRTLGSIPKSTGNGYEGPLSLAMSNLNTLKNWALNIGHLSYQSGDMWHVAFVLTISPQIGVVVLYDKRKHLGLHVSDWKKAYHKACEYVGFYSQLLPSSEHEERIALVQVDDITEVNQKLSKVLETEESATNRKGLEITANDKRTYDDCYYISQSTHAIMWTAKYHELPKLCNHYRATCLGSLWPIKGKERVDIKPKLDTYLSRLKEPHVLVWTRASKVHPELNMTAEWLKTIGGILDELGYRWTCVGEPIDELKVTHETHPLVQFYKVLGKAQCTLEINELTVEDKRYQIYLFEQLRIRGCISIGFRSGTLDGCSAFLGMPTLCFDSTKVDGWERLDKFKMFFHDIYYIDKYTTSSFRKAIEGFVSKHGAPCWKGDKPTVGKPLKEMSKKEKDEEEQKKGKEEED